MKSELVRNQMEMLAQNGGDLSGNNNEILSELLAGKMNINENNNNTGNSLNKQREERLNAAHEEEISEMQKRIQHWMQRTHEMAAEHQKELEVC